LSTLNKAADREDLGFTVLVVSGFVKEVVARSQWVTQARWPPPSTNLKPSTLVRQP